MKDKIILIIKGFFFGIANIIPGVSGGTLAITMGVYEDLISSITHIFSKMKKSLKFLVPLGLGAVIAILLMSKVISACLSKFPFPTILFFVGLIIGGIPLITKKVKGKKVKPTNILIFLITFGIVMAMTFMKEGSNVVNINNPDILMMLVLFLVGIIAAATMVIPGISGSFVLMLLGFYKPIVDTVSKLTDFTVLGNNLAILIPFGIGVVLGIIGVAKLIEFLFAKFEVPTYYAILGFIISSAIGLCVGLIGTHISNIEVLIGIVLFVGACLIGYKLGDE